MDVVFALFIKQNSRKKSSKHSYPSQMITNIISGKDSVETLRQMEKFFNSTTRSQL